MKSQKWIWRGIVIAMPLALLPLAMADDAVPTAPATPDIVSAQVFDAHTVPSEIRHPSFLQQGIIKEVFVKPGDRVAVGQELATEDADLEVLELKSMTEDANSGMAQINASGAERDAAQHKFENLQKLDPGSRNGEELEDAELDFKKSVAEVEFANVRYAKLMADVDKQKERIEKMKIVSSIDGIVEKVSIQEGDFVDPSKPEGVMTVVKNDPLYADVGIPTKLASHLKVGDTLSIAYKDIDASKWFNAKIKNFDPVADAGSDQESIKLQIDNAQGMRAGYWIDVKLPDAQQAMK